MNIVKCPFCHCTDTDVLYGWQCYYVKCDDCGAEGGARYSEEEAIISWNKSSERFTTDSKMKDHEFSEQVNNLRDLVKIYSGTDQLRARLATFLQQFKEKCK